MCLAPFELPAPCDEATANMPEAPDESGSDVLPSLDILPEDEPTKRRGAAAADADPVAAAAAEPVWRTVSPLLSGHAGLGKLCRRGPAKSGRNRVPVCGVSISGEVGAVWSRREPD